MFNDQGVTVVFVGQIFGQVFGNIFDQVFEIRKYSVQYYRDDGKKQTNNRKA